MGRRFVLVVRQRWLLAVSQVENSQFGPIPELALGFGCLARAESLWCLRL